jgi:hypothetical protein
VVGVTSFSITTSQESHETASSQSGENANDVHLDSHLFLGSDELRSANLGRDLVHVSESASPDHNSFVHTSQILHFSQTLPWESDISSEGRLTPSDHGWDFASNGSGLQNGIHFRLEIIRLTHVS